MFLLIFLFPHLRLVLISPFLILAGIFTFPVGTGLYYLCGNAYGGKMEIAAQFARVKPIFSVLLAVLFLKEISSSTSYISLISYQHRDSISNHSSWQGTFRWIALVLGLLTACSWSLGEVFIKLGLTARVSIIDTFSALVSGTIPLVFVVALLSLPSSLRKQETQSANCILDWPFHCSRGLKFWISIRSIL